MNGENNMNEWHILFTGVGRRVELVQAFREASLVLDKRLKLYGADSSFLAPASAYCDFYRQVCGMKEDGYVSELLDICRRDGIHLLIPVIDTDLLILSENKHIFEQAGTKVLVSDPDKIRICRGKNLTAQFFTDCGLNAPASVSDWKKYSCGFPAFIKPKDGSSSINAFKMENQTELAVCAERIGDYIVQPFISGTEYTVDIFADFHGNPVYIVPRIRLAVRAGEVLKTQITMDRQIMEECAKIIEKFHPCGPLTVQLIRDGNHTDHFIEINPRYGGGAPLSMKAGAKSAEALLGLLDAERVCYKRQIHEGAIYSRFEQSVCMKTGRTLPVKGVIFDLDDTLYPEKEYVKSGYQAVAGYLEQKDLAEIMWRFFLDGKPAIDECLKQTGREDELEECVKIYRSHQPLIRLYDGVAELMELLKSRGIRTGIITDGRPRGQENKLRALGLDQMAEDIIITDRLGGSQFRKPCDIAFRIMARRWKLPCENIIYVGDNLCKDFQAPAQLGMQWLWFLNKDSLYYSGTPEGMDYVTDMYELKKRI